MRFTWTIALVAAAIGAAPALAQNEPRADPKCEVAPQLAPRADGDSQQRRDPQITGQGGQTLSEQLSRSEGVICPPANVDPEMRRPAPEGGRTPVIRPPGSPGGDPTVRPK
jgi:hypothetical protein